jgi:hypothetical protein
MRRTSHGYGAEEELQSAQPRSAKNRRDVAGREDIELETKQPLRRPPFPQEFGTRIMLAVFLRARPMDSFIQKAA